MIKNNFIKFYTHNSYSLSQFEVLKKRSVFIKKSFSKIDGRVLDSIYKQINFKKIEFNNIKILSPVIYNFSKKKFFKNRFLVMQYIDGLSGDQILTESDLETTNILKSFFTYYLEKNSKTIDWIKIDKKNILRKLNEINKNIKIKRLKILYKTIFKKINKYYPQQIKWPSSYCHGDLTLGNIIIKEKRIYLIDFLKTYNEGIVQDLAKIIQEIYLGWSSRYFNSNLKIRSNIFYEKIWPFEYWKNLDNYIKTLTYFESYITICRIMPYVKINDEITINWLYDSFKSLNKNNNFFK